MPTVNMKAAEVVDPKVEFVSLVPHAANRIPFRILKKDTAMINLHKYTRNLFAKAAAASTVAVVGGMFDAGANIETAAAAFQEAGLDPTKFVKSEQDGVTAVTAPGAKGDDVTVVRVSKTAALAVTGLKKHFDSWNIDGSDFNSAINASGYLPSLSIATDILRDTMYSVLHKSGTVDEAATRLSKAVSDYQDYVVKITEALPATVFSIEASMMKSDAPAATDATSAEPAGADAGETADAGTAEPKEGTPAGFAAEKVEKTEGGAEGGAEGTAGAGAEGADESTDGTETKETVAKSEGTADFAALQANLTAQLEAFGQTLAATAKEVGDRVAAVEHMAKSTDNALKSTVFGSAAGDPETVEKSEGPKSIPLIDTGLARLN